MQHSSVKKTTSISMLGVIVNHSLPLNYFALRYYINCSYCDDNHVYTHTLYGFPGTFVSKTKNANTIGIDIFEAPTSIW